MKKILWITSMIIAIIPLVGMATKIHKCTDAQGHVTFGEQACESRDRSELVEIKKQSNPQPPRKPSRPFWCRSGISAVVNNLSYPDETSPVKAVEKAESDFTSIHYRRAIKRVDPSGIMPERVSRILAEAFPASEVPGFSSGVVVNVRVCK